MVKMKENGLASRGFTLIELLVVIAIIGLLAAVVLASVGSARNKGADAAVKSQLNAMRAQAELYASNNGNSYGSGATSVCDIGSTGNGLAELLIAAAEPTGGTVYCDSVAEEWVVSAPLTGGTYWCVDSNGAAGDEGATAQTSGTLCP